MPALAKCSTAARPRSLAFFPGFPSGPSSCVWLLVEQRCESKQQELLLARVSGRSVVERSRRSQAARSVRPAEHYDGLPLRARAEQSMQLAARRAAREAARAREDPAFAMRMSGRGSSGAGPGEGDQQKRKAIRRASTKRTERRATPARNTRRFSTSSTSRYIAVSGMPPVTKAHTPNPPTNAPIPKNASIFL